MLIVNNCASRSRLRSKGLWHFWTNFLFWGTQEKWSWSELTLYILAVLRSWVHLICQCHLISIFWFFSVRPLKPVAITAPLDTLERALRLADYRCEHLGVVSHGPLVPPSMTSSSLSLHSGCIVKVATLLSKKSCIFWPQLDDIIIQSKQLNDKVAGYTRKINLKVKMSKSP